MIPSRRFELRKDKALVTRATIPTMAIQAGIRAVIQEATPEVTLAATLAVARWEVVIPTQGTEGPTGRQEVVGRT